MDSPEPKRIKMSDEEQADQEENVLRVGVGVSDFSRLIAYDSYVDKTSFIKEIFEGTPHQLVTVPQCYGKTTVISMLKYFSAIEVDNDGQPLSSAVSSGEPVQDTPNYKIFTDHSLTITEDLEIMDQHFGKYPVIYVDFNSPLSVANPKHAASFCRSAVHQAFREHEYLLKSEKLGESDKERVRIWCDDTEHYSFNGDFIIKGLLDLSIYLFIHFETPCLVLIDNYDSLLFRAMSNTRCEALIAAIYHFFAAIFFNLLRNNKYVCRSFVTGISQSIGVDLVPTTDLTHHSLLQAGTINCLYGFTGSEVDELFEKFAIKEDLAVHARDYYKRHITADHASLFNYWSISRFLMTKIIRNYWNETVTITFLDRMLKTSNVQMFELMCGQNIPVEVLKTPEGTAIKKIINLSRLGFGELTDSVIKSDYFPLLLEEGYLTLDRKIDETTWFVCTWNKEVMSDLFELLSAYAETIPNFSLVSVQCSKALHELGLHCDNSQARIKNFTCILENLKTFYAYMWDDLTSLGDYSNVKPLLSVFPMIFLLAPNEFHIKTTVLDEGLFFRPFTISLVICHCVYIVAFEVQCNDHSSTRAILQGLINSGYEKRFESKDEEKKIKKCFILGICLKMIDKHSSSSFKIEMAYVLKDFVSGKQITENKVDGSETLSAVLGKFITVPEIFDDY